MPRTDDAESIGGQPLLRASRRRPFPPRCLRPVNRSSNGRRPTTSRTADSASGRKALPHPRPRKRIGGATPDRPGRSKTGASPPARRSGHRRSARGLDSSVAFLELAGHESTPTAAARSGELPSRGSRSPGCGPGRARIVVTRSIGSRPAHVQARPEHAAIPAEPLQQTDFIGADRRPAARGIAEQEKNARAARRSFAGVARSTTRPVRGRCGRRAGRSRPRAARARRNGGSSAQSPKTRSRIELSKTKQRADLVEDRGGHRAEDAERGREHRHGVEPEGEADDVLPDDGDRAAGTGRAGPAARGADRPGRSGRRPRRPGRRRCPPARCRHRPGPGPVHR